MLKWNVLAAVIVLGLVCGCSSSKKPTMKEEARAQWNQTRAKVLYGLARQQYDSGSLEASRKSIGEALTLDPQNVPAHVLSGRLWIEQGQLDSAQRELKTARELDAKCAEAFYLQGIVDQRWQRPQQAYESYHQATQLDGGELSYLMAEAELLVVLDRRGEALALLKEKVSYFETSAAIRDAMGQLLVQEKRYGEAVDYLRQASILAPDEQIIREHLAMAEFNAGHHREAATLLARLTREERCGRRADLLTALGESELANGNLREAREAFQAAAQIDGSSPKTWLGLARTSLQANDLARAETSVRKAVSLEGKNPEAMVLLGYLRLRQGKLNESLAAFQSASALDSKDAISLCMSGLVLEKLNRHREAMECYARALRLKPGDDLATRLMADVQIED